MYPCPTYGNGVEPLPSAVLCACTGLECTRALHTAMALSHCRRLCSVREPYPLGINVLRHCCCYSFAATFSLCCIAAAVLLLWFVAAAAVLLLWFVAAAAVLLLWFVAAVAVLLLWFAAVAAATFSLCCIAAAVLLLWFVAAAAVLLLWFAAVAAVLLLWFAAVAAVLLLWYIYGRLGCRGYRFFRSFWWVKPYPTNHKQAFVGYARSDMPVGRVFLSKKKSFV